MSPTTKVSEAAPTRALGRSRAGQHDVSPHVAPRPSFSEAVRNESAFVLRVVRRLGVRDGDVDDVAQEVLLILHRRFGEWEVGISLRSFLFGIIRRTVANHRRKASTDAETRARFGREPVVSAGDPHQEAEQRDAREILEAALSAVDDEQREVFVLFELEGMSMTDVASLTGCVPKTAYARLYAAREAIRRHISRRMGTERLR